MPTRIFLNPPTPKSLQDIENLYLENRHIITSAIEKVNMSIEEACEAVVGGINLEFKDKNGIDLFDNKALATEYFIKRYLQDIKTGLI